MLRGAEARKRGKNRNWIYFPSVCASEHPRI